MGDRVWKGTFQLKMRTSSLQASSKSTLSLRAGVMPSALLGGFLLYHLLPNNWCRAPSWAVQSLDHFATSTLWSYLVWVLGGEFHLRRDVSLSATFPARKCTTHTHPSKVHRRASKLREAFSQRSVDHQMSMQIQAFGDLAGVACCTSHVQRFHRATPPG